MCIRMYVASLAHRAVPRRDRLSRLAPLQTTIHRFVRVIAVPVTVWPQSVGQIGAHVRAQPVHPRLVVRGNTRRHVEASRRLEICEVANRPLKRTWPPHEGAHDVVDLDTLALHREHDVAAAALGDAYVEQGEDTLAHLVSEFLKMTNRAVRRAGQPRCRDVLNQDVLGLKHRGGACDAPIQAVLWVIATRVVVEARPTLARRSSHQEVDLTDLTLQPSLTVGEHVSPVAAEQGRYVVVKGASTGEGRFIYIACLVVDVERSHGKKPAPDCATRLLPPEAQAPAAGVQI